MTPAKACWRSTARTTSTGNAKLVLNRSRSLGGFIAGPGQAMAWVFGFVAPDGFPEIAAATGAMPIGRRTDAAAKRGIQTASRGKVGGDDDGRGVVRTPVRPHPRPAGPAGPCGQVPRR